MSINAVSSQQSVQAPKTQAESPSGSVFTLEPDAAEAAVSAPPAPKPSLNVAPLTSAEIQAKMALLEEQRPQVEARAQAWRTMMDGWRDYMKDAAAVANDQPYGQITKNGEVIATVYNSGAMSGAGATQINPEHPSGMRGPELAKWRAEQIMKTAGGTFTGLDTAETQDGWVTRQSNNLPRMGFLEWGAENGFHLFDMQTRFRDIRA